MLISSSNDDVLGLLLILLVVVASNNARNRHRLTSSAVLHPTLSPWMQLLRNADDGSFLSITGFNRSSFKELERSIFPLEDVALAGVKRGRPERLDCKGKLGLYLLYATSRMDIKHLCLIFGVPPTTCIRYINKMMKLIVKKLKNNAIARVYFPRTDDEKQCFASMIEQREPSVKNCIGFVDGISIPVQCSSEITEQNKDYNGYKHDTNVNNVLAFAPTGKVIYAALNYPGSWHDSTVSQELIELVIETIGSYCLCVDQGFPRSGLLYDKFVGPISKKAKRKLEPMLRDLVMRKSGIFTSLRQAAEWGMRALQGSFSRLKARLGSNKVKRGILLLSIILLHNFRTHFVGLNQIATVFNAEYEQYVNLENYDRIRNYFL